MSFPVQKLLKVYVPTLDVFTWLVQLSQHHSVCILLLCCQKLASVIWVIWHQEIKKGRQLCCLDPMDIQSVRLYCRNISSLICSEILNSHLISMVDVLIMTDFVYESKIYSRDRQMSMYTFRDSTHFGVAMPIKFLTLRYNYIEECKFRLSFDGKGNNTVRLLDLTHNLVDFWYFQFIHLFNQKAKMWRVDKGLRVEVIMFGCDTADEIEYVLQGVVLGEDQLKLLEFLGLQHQITTALYNYEVI